MPKQNTYTAFAGETCIASGEVKEVLIAVKSHTDTGQEEPLLVFEDRTGIQIDFNLQGTQEEVLAKLAIHPHFAASVPSPEKKAGPGRPNLGVVSREVSLLPRHWEWLGKQPVGASAALRRLVDEARKRDTGTERARQAKEAAGKFMWTMAGNLPDFEEACRALYADEREGLENIIASWPPDIRNHVLRLVDAAEIKSQDTHS